MACSSCGNNNSLSSCGCQDNCPTKTSEFLFDGVFSSIPVPAGASLNDVLLLLESYTMTSISQLNINFVLPSGTCLPLEAGTYSYQQIVDAIISYLCTVSFDLNTAEYNIEVLQANNSLDWNDIELVNGWEEMDAINNPAQYAIQNELLYLKGNIGIEAATSLTKVFWDTVPMTTIARVIETMAYEKFSTIGSVPLKLESGNMSYEGPTETTVILVLDSIPAIRLVN